MVHEECEFLGAFDFLQKRGLVIQKYKPVSVQPGVKKATGKLAVKADEKPGGGWSR